MQYDIFQVLITVLLGAAGGFARQLHTSEDGSNTFGFISGCFIAAFMGAIIYFLTVSLGVEPNLSCAIAGICGWVGPHAMDTISGLVSKKAGIDLIPKNEEEGKEK